jgi:shikimate 5-dehydrogenase
VPYKVAIVEHLDGLDEKARQIGAVNTVVRNEDGRLIGYNTDGSGFLWSLTTPLLPDPKGAEALIIGAGGSARAVAFYLADALGGGRLVIANRSRDTAAALAESVLRVYGAASAIGEEDIGDVISSVTLVVNCSTKGQAGTRKLPGGRATVLEPYSALAAAHPAAVPEADARDAAGFTRTWFAASLADIERNNRASAELALRMSPPAVAYDLIYAPLETVFLRHCRLTGHRTANGKDMNIAQAVDAFDKVCRAYLRAQGLHNAQTHHDVVQAMRRAW